MHTVDLGSVTIDRVTELADWPFPPQELFPGITAEQLSTAAALGAPFWRDDQLVLSIHSYVIRAAGTTILLDAGNGNHKERPNLAAHHHFATDYLDRLAATGIEPRDVDIVVCTHLHPDHCGWNTRRDGDAWVPTFPRARHVFARTEFDAMRSLYESAPVQGVPSDLARTFADSVLPVVSSGQADIVDLPYPLLERDGARITLRPAPGHTPGHLVAEIEAGDRGAVITGDVIHHPVQFADLSLSQAGDTEPGVAADTRRELCERYADRDVVVLTAHFPEPTAGRIVRSGTGFAFTWC